MHLKNLNIYVASSFKHLHAVQLLTQSLKDFGYKVHDWTEQASPPEGLTTAERRLWMDTDHGGLVFNFCAKACTQADLVIYLGTAGQDAGVEIGMSYAAGIPILGIRGPLEAPGLMLHGAITAWSLSIAQTLHILQQIPPSASKQEIIQILKTQTS